MPKQQPLYTAQGEQQLMLELWSPEIANDPRAFVRFAYPWGKPGTPLEHITGPRNWQDQQMADIAEYIRHAKNQLEANNILVDMYREAIASGRGIGKSADFGWLSHWFVSTRLGGSVWVAANGEPQLKTKTFPEIAKWVSMGINAHWFEIQATSIKPAEWLSDAVKRDLKVDPSYWGIFGQLWSEENPDAFAGAHNAYGEMALFDEASGIPKSIWTVQQGVFTEKIIDRYWLAFSNPRRNSGAFFECFNGDRSKWRRRNIDARTVEGLAQDAYQAIIDQHGADSDEARVEVYGQFPNSGTNQFISFDTVVSAQQREVMPDLGAPSVMGVDVGRFGNDPSVLAFRTGRDARSIPWEQYRGLDNVQLAEKVANAAQRYKVDAIFVDGNGPGGGVVDVLKSWGYRVIEVQNGGSAVDGDVYANKRAEDWGRMREWLPGGAIPGNDELKTDLISPEFRYHATRGNIVLESKDEMKNRGLASPNWGDALAMTFSQPVARKDLATSRSHGRGRVAKDLDYAILG